MKPVRGVIFDLFHTLTARESEWSERPSLQDIPSANIAMLKRLREAGMRLALLSNSDATDIPLYEASALSGLFDAEVFSCEVGCVKPEARIYRGCLDALGLKADECVFVGDGGSEELQGAKAVGLRTIFVSGVIEELWPERIAARRAVADHHVRWAHEVLPWLGVESAAVVA